MKAKANAWFICFCSILLIIGLSGCAAGSASSDPGTSVTEKSADEQKLDEIYFPKDKIVDVKITIDPDDFQDMMDNASAEEYKTASVEYNGQKFDNVAIRTKGNLSLSSVVNMADSDRYSLKISFDEYVNQTMQGISKVNLNNNFSDASYMREFLSYELAEQMGLPTPKFSYVNVYVNNELWGFYLAIEQIGDAYLKRNFGNSYGALYKANGGTGSELNWLGNMKSYTGLDLKSDKSNNDILLDILDELNNGSDYESVLDVEEVLKFIALNAVAGNFDSYLSEKKHNYYLYEDEGKFNILPWDYNMSFGVFGGTGVLIDEPTTVTLTDRPLIDKLLKVDAYKEKYHEIIKEMIEGYLAEDTFQARTEEIKNMISSYVKADPSAFYTYEQFEQGVTQVVSFNKTQTSSIKQQLDGTIASSGDGSGSASGGMGGGFGGGGGRGMGGGNRSMGNTPQNTQKGAGQAGGADTTAASFQSSSKSAMTTNIQTAEMETGASAVIRQVAEGDTGTAAPNGQGAPGEMVPPDGNALPEGMVPPDGQMPDGMQGGFGGGRPNMQGGMGGGGMGGFPGGQTAAQPQGSAKEAATAGIAIIVLLLSCAFVVFYKRKRI